MGSSTSKVSRAAASSARKYPTRTPVPSQTTSHNAPPSTKHAAAHPQPGPNVRPSPQASGLRDESINLDASDPDFAQSLRTLGPVQPNPTMSPSSAFPHPSNPSNVQRTAAPNPRLNPAIMVLDARSKLQDEADKEYLEAGRRGHSGRQFLDIFTIRQILTRRDERRESESKIEKALGLKQGVVERLGNVGVVELAQDSGRAQRGVEVV